MILVDPRADDPRLGFFQGAGALPAVVVGDTSLAGGLTNVWTDDAAAMRESVRYLHAMGHRRIARVGGVGTFGHTLIRDRAFDEEVATLGAEGLVVGTDYTAVQGAGATRTLLTGAEPPSAIIYDNDVMAVAGLGVASEVGVAVPRELSMIAWDDSPLCEATYPRLSALSHDVTRYGAHVARRLFDRIDGAAHASFLDSVPTLRTRGSTARRAG